MARSTKITRGITLIEAVVVLGIASMMTAGVWTAASAAINNYKKNEVIKQIMLVAQNSRKVFNDSQIIMNTGLGEASLIKSGVVPATMITDKNGAQSIQNSYGGQVSISLYANGTSGKVLGIIFKGLPADACSNTLIKTIGNMSSTDMKRAGIIEAGVTGTHGNITPADGYGGRLAIYNGSMPATILNIVQACTPVAGTYSGGGGPGHLFGGASGGSSPTGVYINFALN